MGKDEKKEKTIGRDAKTGRFITVKEAEKRPATTVVETLKRSGKNRSASKVVGQKPPKKK